MVSELGGVSLLKCRPNFHKMWVLNSSVDVFQACFKFQFRIGEGN